MNKLILTLIGSSVVLASSAGFAGPITDAKKCLNQAAGVASANVSAAGKILRDSMAMGSLKSGRLDLNGWDGTRDDAKGVYHSSYGWGGDPHRFYSLVYMGNGCGILSKSRLACKLQIGKYAARKDSILNAKLPQTVGLDCTVCRGVEYTSSGDIFGVQASMRASALSTDLAIAQKFGNGVVKISAVENENGNQCANSAHVEGVGLGNLVD